MYDSEAATTTSTPALSVNPVMVTVPQPLSPLSPFSKENTIPETPDLLSSDNLVRRNSISLRVPPLGSIADDILEAEHNPGNHYLKARTILSDLKELSERFSDFGSCKEDTSVDGNSSSDDGVFKTQRRHQRRKRKKSITPEKDFFLKKPNTSSSPQSS